MQKLYGPRLKLLRAEEQVNALDIEVRAYSSADPYFPIVEPHSEYPLNSIRLEVRHEPKAAWGLTVGEFFYNLRSSLDQLAWQLALLKTDQPTSRTQFPIFHTPPINEEQVRDIPEPARQIMERLQPYNRAYGVDSDPLWIIHEANRVDKHRLITTLGHRLVMPLSLPNGLTMFFDFPFNDGEEIGYAKPELDAEKDIKPTLKPYVAFDVGVGEKGLTVDDLHRLYQTVRDEIFPLFAGFFPES